MKKYKGKRMKKLELSLLEAINLAQQDVAGCRGRYYGEPRTIYLEIKGKTKPACRHCGNQRAILYLYRTKYPIIECSKCKTIIGHIANESVPHGCGDRGH